MAYFSRLTDIVTCNLTKLLDESDDPRATLEQVIGEMEEGLSGARRSMQTATSNEQRLRHELEEHTRQVTYWGDKARDELQANHEDQARLALVRKREAENLNAGLKQQLQAAASTREHLTTTHRALEARLADARRRLQDMQDTGKLPGAAPAAAVDDINQSLAQEIEDELAALKRELGK